MIMNVRRTVSILRRIIGLAATFVAMGAAPQARAEDGRFEAFSWVHVPNHVGRQSTSNLTTMVEIAPWTSLVDAARQLNSLPPGNRWAMLFIVTDDMASHPSDRCRRQTYELRTSMVAITPAATAAAPTRAPAIPKKVGKSASPAQTQLVPVTRRVAIQTATEHRGPWMENGVIATHARIDSIMRGLKAAGAQIDGVIVDNETTLDATHFMGTHGALAAVQGDPRWPNLARQLGLPVDISGMRWGNALYFAWTREMSRRFDAALNEAVYRPIRAAYPGAIVSNYCSGRVSSAFAWPDINGHFDARSTHGFGSHDSHEFYGWNAPGRLSQIAPYAQESLQWIAFRLEVFKIRGMNASSSRPKHAWIAAKSWGGEQWGRVSLQGHPMWDELIFQLAMNGVEDFLHFSPYLPASPGSPSADFLKQIDADHRTIDTVLQEVNDVLRGPRGRSLVSVQPTWTDRVIASGIRVGAEVVWRCSFSDEVEAVTLRFTDGTSVRIVREPGQCGAWFRHPADRQIITGLNGMPLLNLTPAAPGSATLLAKTAAAM